MKRLNFVKRVLLLVIAVVLFFTSILSSLTMTVYAGANDRSRAWIALGAERSQESSVGGTEFTYDEMRIIGIFLSNYYIPWSTQVNNSNDNDADTKTRENMVTALTESLNFDKSVAEGLVTAVFDMSKTSAMPIYMDMSVDFEDENTKSMHYNKVKCSWFNMIKSSLCADIHTSDRVTEVEYFWEDAGGNDHTIAEFTVGDDNPFNYVLYRIMEQLNTKSGYGTGFLGTSADFASAGSISEESLTNYLSDFANEEEYLSSCALGQQMYIDCFGNIICDNGQGRAFIVIPACMNPSTFIKDGHEAGDSVPVNNLFMMYLNGQGNLVTSSKSSRSIDELSLVVDNWRYTPEAWTQGRGSSETNWDLAKYIPIKDKGKGYIEDVISVYENSDYFCFAKEWINCLSDEEVALFVKNEDKNSDLYEEEVNINLDGKYSVIQDWILFDFLGGASSFGSQYTDTMYRNEYGIFGQNWGTLSKPLPNQFSTGVDSDNAFNMLTDENSKSYVAGIFTSYVFAYFRSEAPDEVTVAEKKAPEQVLSDMGYTIADGVLGQFNVIKGAGQKVLEVLFKAGLENVEQGELSESDLEFLNNVTEDELKALEDSSGTNEGSTNSTENDTGLNDKVFYQINLKGLPSGGSGNFSVEISDEYLDNALKSFMYYILHPTEGIAYIKQWFSKMITSFLLETHEGIVGNTSTNNTTGGSRYLGFSGYVTVPNLHDLSWTQWLLNNYDTFFVYFVIFMSLVLVCYVFLGSISMQRAMLHLIIFAFCAYLPPTLINSTVDYSNKICDNIYGDKFTYWALVQHEMYVDEINAALAQKNESGVLSDFLLAQFKQQSNYQSSSSTAIALKWLAPKKDNYLVNFKKEIEETTGSNNLQKIISGMIQEKMSGETYLEGSDNLFLYRSYTDISSYAESSYNWLRRNSLGSSSMNVVSGIKLDNGTDLGDEVIESGYIGNRNKEYTLQYAIDKGFNYPTQGSSYDSEFNYRLCSVLSGNNVVSNAIKNKLNRVSLDASSSTGIAQSAFNITISNLNNSELGKVTQKQYSTFIFGEYTESPFYYFNFNLKDQMGYGLIRGKLYSNLDNFTLKNFYLQGDGSYFYNNNSSIQGQQGFGEMRDYMDMRTLFYCVIPYLKEANDVVIEWDNEYGLWLYDGIDIAYTTEGGLTPPPYDKDSELYYKWWHNVQVTQLFNMYCPWLDKMYECDYAKPIEITVHGEQFLVQDPLNPYTYFEKDSTGNLISGRYMVFSESEMSYYGLEFSDLTPVERKIINIQRDSYNDLLTLMDYYTFDDEVLTTASAMIETFNFNKEFSQTSLFGEDYVLYPQNYELKNFTYDAYLRLILVNATGELLQSRHDSTGASVNLYKIILDNSSFITGVVMIALDCIATYVIPALKLFFLLAVFALSLLVLTAAVLDIKVNIVNTIVNSLVKPLVKFCLVSIGMAFVVSLFMSNGNTAVTGRGGYTISLGDPTMTMIALVAINLLVAVMYWKICKKSFKDCKQYAEAVATSIAGTATGVFGKAAALVTGGTVAARLVGKVPVSVANANQRGRQNAVNKAALGIGLSSLARRKRKEMQADRADMKLGKSLSRKEAIDSRIAKGKAKNDAYQNRIATGTETRLDKSWLGSKVANRRKRKLDKDILRGEKYDKKLSKRTAKARKANYKAGRNVHGNRTKYGKDSK